MAFRSGHPKVYVAGGQWAGGMHSVYKFTAGSPVTEPSLQKTSLKRDTCKYPESQRDNASSRLATGARVWFREGEREWWVMGFNFGQKPKAKKRKVENRNRKTKTGK